MRDTKSSSVAILPQQQLSRESERRRVPRLGLTATADVIDLSSRMHRSSRTADVGPGGCFVDTLTPFAAGSKVHVRICRGENEFAANGTVVYSQHGLGMGIAFEDDGNGLPNFESWMDEGIVHRRITTDNSTLQPGFSGQLSQLSAVIDLFQLLVSKGILTEAEGSALARKLMIPT